MSNPKILILGHARHGKDAVAEILRDEFGMSFMSSSEAALEIFLFDDLQKEYGYKTVEEAIEAKNQPLYISAPIRKFWADKITNYNRESPSRLACAILANNDCYVGMRKLKEIHSCWRKDLFDYYIFVDASKRLPLEPETSNEVTLESTAGIVDYVIDNNEEQDPETLPKLKSQVREIGKILFPLSQ